MHPTAGEGLRGGEESEHTGGGGEEYFPRFKGFIDATEQEIPRPKNDRRRKTHYSGKRKRLAVKAQLTVNSNGFIITKTNHARGRRHDYDIFKLNHPKLPEGSPRASTSGMMG